jgi:hypothetical protein
MGRATKMRLPAPGSQGVTTSRRTPERDKRGFESCVPVLTVTPICVEVSPELTRVKIDVHARESAQVAFVVTISPDGRVVVEEAPMRRQTSRAATRPAASRQ